MSKRSDIDGRYLQHVINGYSSEEAFDMAVSELGGEYGHYDVVIDPNTNEGSIVTTPAWDQNEANVKKAGEAYDKAFEMGNVDEVNNANAKILPPAGWDDIVAFEKSKGRPPVSESDYALMGTTKPVTYSVSDSSTTADIQDNSTVSGGGYTDTKTNYITTDTPESLAYKADAATLREQEDAIKEKVRASGKTGRDVLTDPDVKRATAERKAAENAAEDAQLQTTTQTTTYHDADGNEISEADYTVSHTKNPVTGEPENVNIGRSIVPVQLTQADADRLNAEAYAEGGFAPRTLEDLQDEANDDAFLASLPTYNGIQFPNQQALDEYKANNPTAGLNTNTTTDDVDDDPVPNGKPKTDRDTFASDNSTQDEVNQLRNDAQDAEDRAKEYLEAGNFEAYQEAQAEANQLTAEANGLQDDIDFEADDDVDTDMFQADFDRENLDDEYASRPEPSVSELRGEQDPSDWRVRLRLAPLSDYLYNAPDPGILAPLAETDGIIFPYVPRIDTVHQARYSNYDLPHSNYRGYFYAGSHQERVIVSATFTAQDTKEANYMLAALHFLRSCTKMFYGQDMQRGTPPPLVFLSGLGDYHFNEHPCAVEIVNINLPNDVDYIKAGDSGTFSGDFMSPMTSPKTKPASAFGGALSRLFGSGLSFGGVQESVTYTRELIYERENQGVTMVPTKLEINFNLVPIQTRDQISNEYSLEDYASGKLLKKGFW